MNGKSLSGINLTKASPFNTSVTTINSDVVFNNITDRLFDIEGRDATKGGRLKLSTSLRSSFALASAASVARRAFSSAVSAARRAAFDLWEAHQDQRPNKNDAPVSPSEIQISIAQIYIEEPSA